MIPNRINSEMSRLRLRRTARRLAQHGWDVMPGAYLAGNRFRCGPGCRTVSCHPARPDWERSASHDPYAVTRWWVEHPHSVLLATGRAFDVLEVSAMLGTSARDRLRAPIAATETGHWMILVRTGSTLRPELAAMPDVVLHGPSSWVPAPPTPYPGGRVRWLVTPGEVEWELPDGYEAQSVLVGAAPDRYRCANPGSGVVQPA